ncbi:TPA: hypothetical protein RSW61_001921 [Vibrio harveyi]|nr:hypothetical protein [Vibrio harveyi]
MLSHDSILGKALWATDPIALATGKDSGYTETIHGSIPTELNRMGSDLMQPFERIDKTINPVRQIDAVDNVSNVVAQKPADALGVAMGAVYGAPALGSAMGSTGAASSGFSPIGGASSYGLAEGGATANAMGIAAPATQSFWGTVGGNVAANVGSSVLTGLLSGGNDEARVIQQASRGRDGLPLLSSMFQTATNVSPQSRRGGFL